MIKPSIEELLAHSPIFLGIKSEKISDLLQNIRYQLKSYKREEYLAFCDEEVLNMQILLSGDVRGEMSDFSGKTIKIEDIAAPRPLAPAFLFGSDNRYPVNIVANQDVETIIFPKDSVLKLMQSEARFLQNYLNLISNRAQFLSNKIKFLSFQSIKGKLANLFVQLAKSSGSLNIILPKSQSELAEMFATTRPSIGRAIREMHNDGIISAVGKEIKILDRARISDLLR